MLMSGYRGRADLTAEVLRDGWLLTSDLGEYDGTTLRVLGRADDMIISGGENVPSAEVAATIGRHPAVAEVEVVGVADPEWGQRVVAVVVTDGGAVLTLDELRDWCSDLPAAARPRDVVVVNDLPRLPSGKQDRLAIRRLAAGEVQP
jgi:O-succinylbenzoic acid--CoA ligase